jgi:hypothetical protein
MPALARALMQGCGLWAGVRKPPREETAGRKRRGLVGCELWGFVGRGRIAGLLRPEAWILIDGNLADERVRLRLYECLA